MLVTQSFGNETEYRRAIFAIWSYWCYCPTGNVLLFTDQPSYFDGFFLEMPVEYVQLTAERIRQMRGEIDFLHRMKIAIIEDAFSRTDGNLIYVDSDVFFVADPTPLADAVAPDSAFMHAREYQFEALQQMELPAGRTFLDFMSVIQNRSFKGVSGQPILVTLKHFSWNAGAMILHREHRHLLADVYSLTDQFYSETMNHASEQYAFSIVLQNTGTLQACQGVVYHYYYRIKKHVLDIFLKKRLNRDWLQSDNQKKLFTTKTWISMLPAYLETHSLSLRDKAIQAFYKGNLVEAYYFVFRAFVKTPFSWRFIKDVLHHTKRQFYGRKN